MNQYNKDHQTDADDGTAANNSNHLQQWALAAGILIALMLIVRYADQHGYLRFTANRLRTVAIVTWVLLYLLRDITAIILRWISAWLVDVASDLFTFPRFLCDPSMFDIVEPAPYTDQKKKKKNNNNDESSDDNMDVARQDDDHDGGGDKDENDDDLCYVVIQLLPLYSMPFGGLESSKDVELFECSTAPPPVLETLVGGSSLARPVSGATTPPVEGGATGTPAVAADPHSIYQASRMEADASIAATNSNAVTETAWEAFHQRLRLLWFWYISKALAFFLYGLFLLVATAWWKSVSDEDSVADPTSSWMVWTWERPAASDVVPHLAFQFSLLAVFFTLQVVISTCYLLFNPLIVLVCIFVPNLVLLWRNSAKDGASDGDAVTENRWLRLLVQVAWGLIRMAAVRGVIDYWSHVLRRSLDRVVREWKPSFGARDLCVQVKVFRTGPYAGIGGRNGYREPKASKLQLAARWARYFCTTSICSSMIRHEKFCLAFRRKRHGA